MNGGMNDCLLAPVKGNRLERTQQQMRSVPVRFPLLCGVVGPGLGEPILARLSATSLKFLLLKFEPREGGISNM